MFSRRPGNSSTDSTAFMTEESTMPPPDREMPGIDPRAYPDYMLLR